MYLCPLEEELDSLDLDVLFTVYWVFNYHVRNAVLHKDQSTPRCTSLSDREMVRREAREAEPMGIGS